MSNTNIGFRNMPRYRDMTPDKALPHIEAIGIGNRNVGVNMLNALIVAEKALKRVTPTKTTHEATLYRCNTCPNCGNVVDEFTEFIPGQRIHVYPDYCKFCGQALLWE